MRYLKKHLGLVFSILIVGHLTLPGLRWLTRSSPAEALYGYTESIPVAPDKIFQGISSRVTQRWIEKTFDANLGFRRALIRSFNELNFRIFREAPKQKLYSIAANGLYSAMSLENLNFEVTHGDELKKHFLNEIPKLRKLQELLLSKGKYFVVVIGSSKPYVYPEGLGTRFLVGGDVGIFDRAVSFGDALKSAGVNVIDSGPLLREFLAATGIPTHPESGVHWNYYAGCVVARTLLDKVRTSRLVQVPNIDCGSPTFTTPKMVDNDGLFLMNIWSRGGLTKSSPYPNIRSQAIEGHRSNMVFIGDSFSDQIRYSFQEGKVFSKLTMSNYFRTRAVFEQGRANAEGDSSTAREETTRRELIEDIRFADIVVLQMVDYNVIRWGYGFPDYLLKQPHLLD